MNAPMVALDAMSLDWVVDTRGPPNLQAIATAIACSHVWAATTKGCVAPLIKTATVIRRATAWRWTISGQL
jgi:hypothetical protein